MKFLIVLATVFSLCCCFSDLRPSFGFPYETSEWRFQPLNQRLLNNKVTDEEILRCRYFMDKISEELDLISSQEEIQDILSQCDLLLKKGIKYQTRKDDNINRLSSFEYNNYDFVTISDSTIRNSVEEKNQNTASPNNPFASTDSTIRNSVEEKNQNTGPFDYSSPFLATEQYEASSTKTQTDEPENPSPINTNWSLWSLFSGASETSGSSSPVLVTEQNDASKIEKQLDESEVQKTKYETIIISPMDMSLSVWSFLYSYRNSSDSSKRNRSGKKFGKDQAAELGIDFGNSPYLGSTTTEIPTVWNIVMPGTKWCGAGSAAKNDDDLGYFEDVDRCCQAHDKCNDLMLPGESKYNLKNTSPFTVLSCKCDDEMHDCLSRINSVAANTVGQAYFNIFGRMCYTLDYPRKCKIQNLLLGCQQFEVDTTAEKIYQWKPTKKYLTMPFK